LPRLEKTAPSGHLHRATHIEPGSPRETGHAKSFNSKPRDGPLNGEILDSLRNAEIGLEG
jgi:hypothetical protein